MICLIDDGNETMKPIGDLPYRIDDGNEIVKVTVGIIHHLGKVLSEEHPLASLEAFSQ